MISPGSRVFAAVVVAAISAMPALAQRQSDPNIGHFYMARQQITITDDAPSVNDQRSTPGANTSSGAGALPSRPMGLPRAGWVPYSQSVPGLSTNLPKTNNGVPEKAPPPSPAALRARQNKLAASQRAASKAAKASTPAPPSAPSVKAYSPYQQYAPDAPASGSAAASGMNSNANVRGSVLHWARHHR